MTNTHRSSGVSRENSRPIFAILSRLQGVKKTRVGWSALCPGHNDETASLSLCVGEDDDRVLISCFAGCAPAQVLNTIGLTLADLFVKRDSRHMTRSERAELLQKARQAHLCTAVDVLGKEATVVVAAATQVINQKSLTEDDYYRLVEALQIFDNTRSVLHVR